MSASPVSRQPTEYRAIPKRILISDMCELPNDYSSTPGGTLYSTTPGGTKIVYEKSFLLSLRNSPVSKTPPSYTIPEHLQLNGQNSKQNVHKQPPKKRNSVQKPPMSPVKKEDDSELFDLEI